MDIFFELFRILFIFEYTFPTDRYTLFHLLPFFMSQKLFHFNQAPACFMYFP